MRGWGVADLSYPNSKVRRGRCQGNPPGTICNTITAATSCLYRLELEMTDKQIELSKRLKIRKLLPEECFILMGLTKEDCDKCRAVGVSDSQLYKIAGNGLICNCVAYIMEHLYKALGNEDYETTDEKMVRLGYGV